jgi:hypothetical protein
MQKEDSKSEKTNVGAMKKRRETMADGKRYIVYYTFETSNAPDELTENEEKENV